MTEDQKAEAAAPGLDPRAAEVLRFLDRAKGTIAKTEPNLTLEATAESRDSTARVLERVVAAAGERLADFQRGQDGAVRELRVSVDRLIRQADVLAAIARLVDEAGGDLGHRAGTGPCRPGSHSPGEPMRWRRAPTTSCSRS